MIAAHLNGFLDEIVPRAIDACRDADLIVSHSFCLFGLLAAEATNRPCAVVHPFPTFVQGDNFLWNGESAGVLVNRLLWSCARPFLRGSSDLSFAPLFRSFGVRPRRDVLLDASHSRLLNLLPFSPELVPADPRWRAHYRVTGYWSTDQEGSLPDDLQAFLQAGPPPVVVTFGSMTGLDRVRVTDTLVAAVQRAGLRMVLQSGAAGLGSPSLPQTVHLVREDVPHLTLFRQAACVVHHGGAGTTGTALRAGVPQIVLPLLGDQTFWARRLVRTGVCRHWRRMHGLSSGWLSRALTATTTDRSVRERARTLALRVAAEDGHACAVELLEAAATAPSSSAEAA
jgi:UDP:flavonoid glycosyltransferase YjiC (YdhE family)